MLKKEQFLPTITTTKGSDWKDKIKETKILGINKVALFPTCLDKEQRKELYALLSKSWIRQIPFVHIRTDMDYGEIDYLTKQYNTKVLNMHTRKQHKVFYNYTKYKDILYIENTSYLADEQELEQFAGICLDFSHLEDDRRVNNDLFAKRIEILEKYRIGCNHISAVLEKSHLDYGSKENIFSMHHYNNLSEFDYLRNYPEKYFSNFVAMELENTLKEQLIAIDYITAILNV